MIQANHNFECDYKSCFTLIFIKERYHISKYKRYLDDPSVSVSKSTKLDRNKRSARSNTAISITQSVVSTELKAVVPTESVPSHKGETFGKVSAQPHTIVKQICFPNGNVLFFSLFSLVKNWMHNVIWGCAEIVPNICTRQRSNYMRLQRCVGILVHKWLCTIWSIKQFCW